MTRYPTDTAGRTLIPGRADQLIPGLYVPYEVPLPAGGYCEFTETDPLRIVSIEPAGDRLLFTFDNRIMMHFDPAEPVEMVCMPAPDGHPSWCRDPEACEAERDGDGTLYHASAPRRMATRTIDTNHDVRLVARAHRLDDPDGSQGPPHIVLYGFDGSRDWDGPELAAADVRTYARLLLDLATEVDGLADVEDIRLGDEIETAEGWQTVTGVMHDAECAEVALYTTRDDDPAGRWPLGSTVAARRGPTNPATD